MTFLGREQLLKPIKRRFTTVDTLMGMVRIRSLSELERSQWENSALDKKGKPSRNGLLEFKCRLIVACVVDGEGNPVFTANDIPQLMQQDSIITDRITDACQEHCGIRDSDVEELAKNYAETNGESLPTGSPESVESST